LQNTLRETDQFARLGGDEFTVILKTPDRVKTEQVVNRISAELSAPVVLDGIHLNDLSASIGMAVFPEDGKDVDELVRSADAAMYLDKKKRKSAEGALDQPRTEWI
jgi:diguanylate cyclase (GGDEF)-like protein